MTADRFACLPRLQLSLQSQQQTSTISFSSGDKSPCHCPLFLSLSRLIVVLKEKVSHELGHTVHHAPAPTLSFSLLQLLTGRAGDSRLGRSGGSHLPGVRRDHTIHDAVTTATRAALRATLPVDLARATLAAEGRRNDSRGAVENIAAT